MVFSMSPAEMQKMISALSRSSCSRRSCRLHRSRAAPGRRGNRRTACRRTPDTACRGTGRCEQGCFRSVCGYKGRCRIRSPWMSPHTFINNTLYKGYHARTAQCKPPGPKNRKKRGEKNFGLPLDFYRCPCYNKTRSGGLAQLVRVPASHAGSLGFESLILHQKKLAEISAGFFLFEI